MAQNFPFKVDGLDKVLALFNQMPKRLQRELYHELKNTAKEIRDGAKKDAPADQRRLAQTISDKEVKKTLFEVVAQSNYAGFVEFGTKSKTVVPAGLESIAAGLKGVTTGSSLSLYEAILAWVKRKGIGAKKTKSGRISKSKSSLAEQRTAAFFISRSIRKYGISPQPYFYKQIPPAEARLRQRVINLLQQVLQ